MNRTNLTNHTERSGIKFTVDERGWHGYFEQKQAKVTKSDEAGTKEFEQKLTEKTEGEKSHR
jgi:hypothetical protein